MKNIIPSVITIIVNSFKNIITWWFVLSFVFVSTFSGCNKNEVAMHNESSTVENTSSVIVSNNSYITNWGDSPLAMIRINGKYYTCTEIAVDAPDNSQIIGHITSVRPDDTDVWWCIKDDQVSAGFSEFLNAPYAQVDSEIIIRHGEEWHRLCETIWTEPSTAD